MKIKLFICLLQVLIISAPISSSAQSRNKSAQTKERRTSQKKGTIELFNGKNLSNWVFHLKNPDIDPSTVFSVQNGVIHIKGDPFGYMRTVDKYSDYTLHVEWRWPGEASNSGVFIHGQAPDTIWLRTFECQLKAGNAGDFVCMNGATMNEQKNNSRVVAKMAESSEKPTGEWNTMEVICKSNTIEVYVNGVLQNKGTGLSSNSGYICLQNEGKAVEFRKVFLTSLPEERRK